MAWLGRPRCSSCDCLFVIRGRIPQQVARAAAKGGGLIIRIVKCAVLEGEAATADTGAELLLELLQGRDAPIEQPLPLTGNPDPVAAIRGAPLGQAGQGLAYLAKAQPHALRHPDEGDAAQHILRIEPLSPVAAHAADQPLLLVKAQGAGLDAGAFGYLADGQPFAFHRHA